MTRFRIVPLLLGLAMGAMMVWMVHAGRFSDIAIGFVLAHVAVIAVAVLGVLGLAYWRGAPVKAAFAKLHRPTPGHAATMLLGAVLYAALVCTICFSGLVEMT